MAGSDSTQQARLGGPAIVLVAPQLGENVGAAARAMLNGGLTDLRLVAPRPPWPNPRALAAASGADHVVEAARVFDRLEDAVADLRRLYASTARPRDLRKVVLTPRQAVREMRQAAPDGGGCGVLFGPERTGLDSDQVALADAVLTVPLNPAYSSLNLGQAVMLVSYEWYQSGAEQADTAPPMGPEGERHRQATRAELHNLFRHLESELDAANFLWPPHTRANMVRNLRNFIARASPTEQEVKTLHGVVTALAGRKWKREQD
ncbi:MAG TPA: RNA methyltransferase [Thermoanaerobaculia bacterium]|jgi:tRNA/rRNA methyltransferase|nr:RNA methyltransferase [Thermoanaerobaculia bacterium]